MATRDISERIQGLILGFAVGDALGAPLAGLPPECEGHRLAPITGFTTNPEHPYFARLGRGCYTENTRLVLDSIRDYSDGDPFDRQRRIRTLVRWGRLMQADMDSARWPGPTTLSAVLRLADGLPPPTAPRDSVGALYRCLPIAAIAEGDALRFLAQSETELTHLHPDSTSVAVLFVTIVRRLLLGDSLESAIRTSVEEICNREGTTPLLRLCRTATRHDQLEAELRTQFGTGARCSETVPLTLSIITRFGDTPTQALLYAANCGKASYAGGWNKDTAERNGGNSDGIAALVGALLGASQGGSATLAAWPDVEDSAAILAAAVRLSARFQRFRPV
jgi:ADP-ribosylglycohydrolase